MASNREPQARNRLIRAWGPARVRVRNDALPALVSTYRSTTPPRLGINVTGAGHAGEKRMAAADLMRPGLRRVLAKARGRPRVSPAWPSAGKILLNSYLNSRESEVR